MIRCWYTGELYHASSGCNLDAFYVIDGGDLNGVKDRLFKRCIRFTICDLPMDYGDDYSRPTFVLGGYGDGFEYSICKDSTNCSIVIDRD